METTRQTKKTDGRRGGNEGVAWRAQSESFCRQEGLPIDGTSWTSAAEAGGADLSFLSERAKKLCDIAVCLTEKRLGRAVTHADLAKMYADVSQGVSRKPWTTNGVLPSFTTSFTIFSFAHCRLLSSVEHARIMGFDTDSLPEIHKMSSRKLHNLVGEAMCLPSMGTVLACLVTELPGLFAVS